MLLAALAFVGGLVVGPWLGILVDRVVPGIALAAEHRCARCEAGLGRRSLVPVAAWFQRCPACDRGQWWRYPLVDLLTAVAFGALALRFGARAVLGPYLGLAAVLVVLSVIDLETHLLPNRVVWPSILGGAFLVLVVSGQLNDAAALHAAFYGAAAFGGVIGLIHLIHEPAMGRGDVKLSLLLGLFVGWPAADGLTAVRFVLYALMLACLVGGLVGTLYNLIRRRGRAEIPFGPALALGTLVVVLATGPLAATPLPAGS